MPLPGSLDSTEHFYQFLQADTPARFLTSVLTGFLRWQHQSFETQDFRTDALVGIVRSIATKHV